MMIAMVRMIGVRVARSVLLRRIGRRRPGLR
jgi:hypothetical protein